jgi:hypothetical protein
MMFTSIVHLLSVLQFHVDKLSSAHIYLRLKEGETWDAIPQDLLTDLAQLTKANSIEGWYGLLAKLINSSC